ncbi:MAG: hypothetical protein SGBAC_012223 [Bacillariaceae sp.]
MIDPNTDPKGETVDDYCKRRWGGAGWTTRLKQEGRKDGAQFSDWKWWPHTSRAHQLILYCAENKICSTDKVNQYLFQAEYENGENISDVETLVKIGKELGLPEDKESELQEYLAKEQGKAAMEEEIRTGRQRYSIKGVPFFVVGKDDRGKSRPYGLSGAQAKETFLELFEELSS